jgi:multidrug efflux pump subunit AcrA (membrane-fusion protein)
MNKSIYFLIFLFFFLSCNSKQEKITPSVGSLSESIYASGILKSKQQYELFATVIGIIEKIYVTEGSSVKKGEPIFSISNEVQRLNNENAELAAAFSDITANQGKLREAQALVDVAKSKMKNDSVLLQRQKNLWSQQIGSKIDLEQRELNYQNSKATFTSAVVNYTDLKRQLDFTSSQSKKNLLISNKMSADYILRSDIDGMVYRINKKQGELVSTQTPLAIIGDSKQFILEMQVDEYDIIKIKEGLLVFVTLDSYKGKVFEAKVTRVNPLMNERSKTFLIEAAFIRQPEILYPNSTFEANIVIQTKNNILLIPRRFLLNDSTVLKSNGDKVIVQTGLRDYQKVEILSGITKETELIVPE